MLSPYTCGAMMMAGGGSSLVKGMGGCEGEKTMNARKGRSNLAGPRFLITWINSGEAKNSGEANAKPRRKVTFNLTPLLLPVQMGITQTIHPTCSITETDKAMTFHIPGLSAKVVYQKDPAGMHLMVTRIFWKQEDRNVEARVVGCNHQTRAMAYDERSKLKELNHTYLELILSGTFEKNQ